MLLIKPQKNFEEKKNEGENIGKKGKNETSQPKRSFAVARP